MSSGKKLYIAILLLLVFCYLFLEYTICVYENEKKIRDDTGVETKRL